MKNFSVEPPAWPAFECIDGFAWHPRESLRHCHKGQLLCSAETLAAVYRDEPIDQLLALRTILLEARNQRFALVRIFPDCAEHVASSRRADQIRGIWRRAAMTIHEDAVPYLRDAKPGLYAFKNACVASTREHKSAWYKNAVQKGIPVHDPKWDRRHPPTGEATRTAQIFWASNLIAEREARVA